jgi:AAA domain
VLVQGPPGTGKTSIILGSLSVLVADGLRTLVCSPSNCAVDDIARKVVTNGLIDAKDGAPYFPFGMMNAFSCHLTNILQLY